MLLSGRRVSSLKQYEPHIRAWNLFCVQNGWNSTFTSTHKVLSFLHSLLEKDFSYSTINTAKSALSTCTILDNGVSLGGQPDVQLFMKGVFNKKPPIPRYLQFWDPQIVLDWMEKLGPPNVATMPLLSQRLAILILLCTGQRPQILTSLSIDKLTWTKETATFTVMPTQVKQGRPGYKPPTILLKKYSCNALCAYTHLRCYILRTKYIRESAMQLFLTYGKPHRPATGNTISRWIKTGLAEAGVDAIFGPGSTRGATASKALLNGAPVDVVLASAGWSRENTFQRFYNRPITIKENCGSYTLPK